MKAHLELLRSADPAFQIFGASYHKYHLSMPMTEKEVLAFEKHHAITLPEEYRSFLLMIARDGAGPYYGLLPPEGYCNELKNVKRDFLSLPFPHREAWNLIEESMDLSIQEKERKYFDNSWTQGSMRLCNYGCGAHCILVVTGQARGQIWLDYRSIDQGIFPVASDFLTWYEQWLEQSFTEVKALQNCQPTFRRRTFDKNGRLISHDRPQL